MVARDIDIRTNGGRFAAVDYGGAGVDCLLIHGTGQNATAWRDVAAVLARHCRVVAFDMRGHGQTQADSTGSEDYWRDIGPIIAALDLDRPVLIGHSTGAYAAMAHVAANGTARAIACIDGFVLDARGSAPTDWASQEMRSRLFELFRYGWKASETARDAYIAACVAGAADDPFNTGVEPSLLRTMLLRCFMRRDDAYLRRPTMKEIAIASSATVDAAIGPYRDIYGKLNLPMLLVRATEGLAASRYDEITTVAAAPGRTLISMDGGHNLPMQQPAALARIVTDWLAR